MAMTERTGKEAFLRQQNAIMKRIDSRPHLAAIRCPTLVLCGRQDEVTPLEAHQEMADAIPRPVSSSSRTAATWRRSSNPTPSAPHARLAPITVKGWGTEG